MSATRGSLPGAVAVVLGLALSAAACAGGGETALDRGDRLWAQGDEEAAIAEYRLARRQRGDEPGVLLRLAHAYASRGDVSTSVRYYADLLEADSSHRYQAAADLAATARSALDRAGRDRMARALEPVVPLGLDLIPRDLRLELARHHTERQEFQQALPLYLSVLEEDPEVGRRVYYETARAFQELGGCREALGHFERYVEGIEDGGGDVGGARWHYGSCLYEVAQEDWRRGRDSAALGRLDRLVRLGTPQTLMDRAQYLRGELLLRAGREEEALEAYREVLRLNPARSDPLARSAEEKVRRIRYGYE